MSRIADIDPITLAEGKPERENPFRTIAGDGYFFPVDRGSELLSCKSSSLFFLRIGPAGREEA